MKKEQMLDQLLSAANPQERRFAAEELSTLAVADEKIISVLARGLTDMDKGVRDACSNALINKFPDLHKMKANAVAPLISNSNIEIRNLAGDILLQLGFDAAYALLPFLNDSDPDNQKFAADIIGLTGDEQCIPAMEQLLNDPDINVRCAGIEGLGNLRAVRSLNALIAAYREDFDTRPYIIEAVGLIGGASAEQFLLGILGTEEDEFLQIASIDALAICGSDISIAEKLVQLLPQASHGIQLIILKTIIAIAFRMGSMVEFPQDLRFIACNALMDDDSDTRIAGLLALGSEYFPDDVEAVLHEVFQRNSETQQQILSVILSASSVVTVDRFFTRLLEECNSDSPTVDCTNDSFLIELFGYLPGLWSTFERINIDMLIKSLQKAFPESRFEVKKVVSELLLSVEREAILSIAKQELESGNVSRADDMRSIMELLNIPESL